jgi:hypothetical protein
VIACHCTHCQKQSGSALSTIAVVPRAAVQRTGVLTDFVDTGDSGGRVTRQFCGRCGSPVFTDIPGEQHEAVLYLKTGTLDDNSGAVPASHIWTDSAQSWFPFPDGAVKVPRQ